MHTRGHATNYSSRRPILVLVAFSLGCMLQLTASGCNDSQAKIEAGQHSTAIAPAGDSAGIVAVAPAHDEPDSIATPVANSLPSSPGKIESVPLAKRQASKGEHLFETLDPKAIGLDFFHAWTKRPGQLRNNTTGCGVAMGDYDGDGRVDVFLPRSTDGGRLYRNLGDFRFQDVTEKAGIISNKDRWTTGASFVDVDNDGDLDLYVCAFDCPNHLYVNQGNGTFLERGKEYGLAYKGSSAMAAFCDYDRDGDLDVYLMTNHIPPKNEIEYSLQYDRAGVPRVPDEYLQYHDALRLPDGSYGVVESGQFDHLYKNNGDGTFSDVSKTAGISGNHKGLGVAWWDYNNDGWPDVYVANDFYGPDRLYRNNHDGTFTDVAAEALPHTPWFSMGCDQGDLNNDGLFDLIGTDMSADTHFRANVTMGDVQDEGWFLELPMPRQYMRNAIYLGTGGERLLEVAYLAGLESTNWTWSVRFVDLDQDGKADLHITNGMSRDWGNSDMKMKAMKLGPINSEVYNDYWDNSEPLRERNFAFRNLGNLKLENVSQKWGLDYLGVSFGAGFGDLDGDGDLDLVINNFQDMVTVARNGGTTGNAVRIRLKGTESNRWGIGATVRVRVGHDIQASYLALARGFMSSSDPTVHFGLGDAKSIDALVVEWPSGQRQSFTNLPVNRLVTITEPTGQQPQEEAVKPRPLFARSEALEQLKHREKPFDDFAREPLLPIRLSQLGPGLASGDVNGDKLDDLFLGGAKGDWGSLYFNQGAGKWASPDEIFPPWFNEEVECEDMGALLFDADSDGDSDLFIVNGGVECEPNDVALRDELYLNDGTGKFTRAAANQVPDLRDSGSVAAAADYDRDGDLDLYVGSRSVPGRFPESPSSRLLNNEAATFRDATAKDAPDVLKSGLVTSAVWSDADGDGWIDLLVTHDWGPIKLFLNDHGRLRNATAKAGLDKLLGWWNGIAGRDLDGDGDVDYVVTNRGRNTVYRVSPERPARMFYGDFTGDDHRMLLEGAYDEQGRLVPTRSKPEMQRAMPFVEAAFPTFKEYAPATLADVVGDKALQDSLQLTANTADSVILRNDGHGRFTVEPLALLAQVSPGFGVALDDFNGDGYSDAYIVQNLYSPRREIGHMDGGMSVLLLGQEDGQLVASPAVESGLIVPGDAKSLVTPDVNRDGWPDVVVGMNDAPVMAFENQKVEGRRMASVRLHGRGGNPTGVGARVRVQRSDGWTQTAEVQAGGGYLSQQPATLYFGLGRDSQIVAVEVRWPDGEVTRYVPKPSELEIEIRQPESRAAG